MRIIGLLVILTTITVVPAAADFEAFPIKNVGLARIVSGVENILKTNDLVVGGVKLLDQPTMEFMIELDHKGERIVLVPTDFNIEAVDQFSRNKVDTIGVELRCRYEGLPLIVDVDYIRDPAALYQQKSITITPCRAAKGAVLRRVTLEEFRFKKNVRPLSVGESGFGDDRTSAFAFVEEKSGKGVAFDFPSGKLSIGINRSLTAVQEMEVPIENGWKSGKFGISAVSSPPDAAFKSYRRFVLETRHPELVKDAKFGELEKKYAACFAACQYLPPCTSDGRVTAVGHVADNKGFIIILNSGAEPAKVAVPLASASLKLQGELKLLDVTSPGKPSDLGTKTISDNVEIEVAAGGYRIVGVNVE